MGNGNVRKAKSTNTVQTEQPPSTSSTEQTEHQLTLDNSEYSKPVIDLEPTSSLPNGSSDSPENVPPAGTSGDVEQFSSTSGIPAEAPYTVPSAPLPEVSYTPVQQGYPGQPPPSYPAQPFPGQPQPGYPAQPLPGHPQPGYAPVPGQPRPAAYAPLPGAIADGGQPWPPVQSAPLLHGPHIPIGYNVRDALQRGNIIQMICKATNKPLTCVKGATNANGAFGKDNSTFTVVVPKGATQGVIMLHNTVSTGLYLSINKGGFFNVGKGRKWSHLKPIVQPDNSVTFQSVEWGGLLCFNHKGFPSKATSQQDPGSQFHIRIEKQMNINSQPITTPFGRPSVANQLRTDCLVQIFLKNFNQYMSVDKTGAILHVADGNDTETCFKLLDRGLGRFSFQSHKFKALQLSMANNVLSAKGGVSDRSVDFQLKENANGTVCFESVNCPGAYIGIQTGGVAEINLNMAVVTFTGIGRTTTLTKTFLN